VSATRTISAIVANDGRRLLRDQFLLGAAAYIAACAIALRWLVPWLEAELAAENGFILAPYVPLGVSYFVLVNTSVLTGTLGGFLLLETREERTIKALLVTPTPLAVHLGTLAAGIVLAGVVITIALSALVGVGIPTWPGVVVSAAVGAPTGVVLALILATAASNKVEAFAVMKLSSVLGLVPVVGYFLPEPLQYLAGIAPPYWACKIWWLSAAGESGGGWLVLPGVLVSVAWIALLVRRFGVAARR